MLLSFLFLVYLHQANQNIIRVFESNGINHAYAAIARVPGLNCKIEYFMVVFLHEVFRTLQCQYLTTRFVHSNIVSVCLHVALCYD